MKSKSNRLHLQVDKDIFCLSCLEGRLIRTLHREQNMANSAMWPSSTIPHGPGPLGLELAPLSPYTC